MSDQAVRILTFLHILGRLTAEETAMVLRFSATDISILIGAGLLKPLGRPAKNSVKYFAAVEIARLARDVEFLSKCTKAIAEYWRIKNERRNNGEGSSTDA